MSVLCYHAVDQDWPAPMSMSPHDFAAHARWLARHRTVLPLVEAIERMDRSGRLPRGRVALTFDDGFRSVHDHAFPELVRLGLPSTVFLVARTLTEAPHPVDWVDLPPSHRLDTLSPEEIHHMQEAGVEFGSHSFSHLDLTSLSFAECVRDLRDSRELLESVLGRPVRLLAYPRGRHNETVRAAAREAGYSHAFTLPDGPEAASAHALPRVGIYRGNTVGRLRVKSSRSYLPIRTGVGYRLAKQGGSLVGASRSWLA